MVIIGLAALILFDLFIVAPGFLSGPSEDFPFAATAVYVVLPFLGSAWLLKRTWKFLIAEKK
jgi:hypothetical protein